MILPQVQDLTRLQRKQELVRRLGGILRDWVLLTTFTVRLELLELLIFLVLLLTECIRDGQTPSRLRHRFGFADPTTHRPMGSRIRYRHMSKAYEGQGRIREAAPQLE